MTLAADAAVCQCGHGYGSHAFIGAAWECWMCNCFKWAPDANRPDDGDMRIVMNQPAVPDREGATEQLADLLAAHHRYIGDCACGWRPDYSAPDPQPQHRAHVAAVIVAAGWRKA